MATVITGGAPPRRPEPHKDATHAFAKNGQRIYACVIEAWNPSTRLWDGQTHYIHADSTVAADLHFKTVFPDRRTHRIVATAPCIGWNVADRKGLVVIG